MEMLATEGDIDKLVNCFTAIDEFEGEATVFGFARLETGANLRELDRANSNASALYELDPGYKTLKGHVV